MIKIASVFLRNDGWYLIAMSQTTVGIWLSDAPFVKVAIDEPIENVGAAILTALRGSRDEIPHPDRFEGLFDPMLKLAGVRSWSAFSWGSRSVSIEDDGCALRFEPEANRGPKDGYAPLPEHAFQIPNHSSSADVGLALKRAH